jgi:hypothetical protein
MLTHSLGNINKSWTKMRLTYSMKGALEILAAIYLVSRISPNVQIVGYVTYWPNYREELYKERPVTMTDP